MKKNTDIANELKAISLRVAEVSDQMPYSVPPGYFDQFPASVLSLVKNESFTEEFPENNFTTIAKARAENPDLPFSIPEGYFEGFADRMINLVRKENEVQKELNELSPFIAGLSRSNPFFVPENYFQNLSIPVREPDSKEISGRVVSFTQWRKLAAAAVITGIVFLGAMFFLKNNSSIDNPPPANETVSIEAMENFLDKDDLDFPAPPPPEGDDLALLDINENTIGTLLESVGDKAIAEFMKDNPGADQSASVN